MIEGVRIIFRNFRGREGKYNKEGDRNFGIVLPADLAAQMLEDGWNVKYLKPREEDLEEAEGEVADTPWLPCALGYNTKGRPPRVVQITSRGRTNLEEEDMDDLDFVDIATDDEGNQKVDIIVKPFPWDDDGRTRIKAYVQSLYITIEEDPLAMKYADLDEQ